MAIRSTGAGTSVRRSGGSDTNVTGHVEGNMPRIVGARKLEADYYAQRAAEAEARRLARHEPLKKRRSQVDPQRMQHACYILWLHNEGYKPRKICEAFGNAFTADFVNKVQCCATCIDATPIEPPAEILARIKSL